MKRLLSGLIIGGIISTSVLAFADVQKWDALKATFKVLVDGKDFVAEYPTVAIEGRTYLPLKAVGDALGVSVQWNAAESRVEIEKSGSSSNTPAPGNTTSTIAGSGINIVLSKVDCKVGETVEMFIDLSNISQEGLNNCNFGLVYDNTALEVVDIIAGDIVTNPNVNFGFSIDNEKGKLGIIFSDETGVGNDLIKTNGRFAKIKVKVKDDYTRPEDFSGFGLNIGAAFANFELQPLDHTFVMGGVNIKK
ncbi:MAG: hypothetical protein GX660_07625 [Clostridiaceae bacterium]|nr:hypothetical protein [Clostridiaceae bacterium]